MVEKDVFKTGLKDEQDKQGLQGGLPGSRKQGSERLMHSRHSMFMTWLSMFMAWLSMFMAWQIAQLGRNVQFSQGNQEQSGQQWVERKLENLESCGEGGNFLEEEVDIFCGPLATIA